MKKSCFQKLIQKKVVILDGATATEFIKRGMPQGVCPEYWAFQNPKVVNEIHNLYADAGANIVYVPSFGANRSKLEEFDLTDQLYQINYNLAKAVKENLSKRSDTTLAFGDIAPTGQFIEPFGPLSFEKAVAIYKEQVKALIDGGVDGFAIETMLDIQEARAALIAVKESCALPVMVTMTFDETQRTLTGNTPLSALITLQSLGADAFGCNCSTGPEDMVKLIASIKPYATIPLLAKPNAGMPKLVNNKTVFDMSPATFAQFATKLVEAGANLIGGCCGTTPEHIAAQSNAVKNICPRPATREAIGAVSSARSSCLIDKNQPFRIIGERINPTGKKKLQAELRQGQLGMVKQFALQQSESGAAILDVNMGLSGINEKEMMLKSIAQLSQTSLLPLCIDSTRSDVIEAALRLYPGRALVNSISLEKERILETLPIAARYGAMFILLPLEDSGIPDSSEERIRVIKEIFTEAQKYGYKREDICVDALIMTISSSQSAAKVALDTIDWCSSQFGVNTVCGLSNVSFGMPERKWINAGFLGMTLGKGLNMAIANPESELITNLIAAADVINGVDPKMRSYLKRFGSSASTGNKSQSQNPSSSNAPLPKQIFDCVVNGDEEKIASLIELAIADKIPAETLVNDCLIPAINKVGDLYDCKKFFLPQLIMGADTMRRGFQELEPLLAQKESNADKKAIVILATVEGDIHDIGKNIVALMLKNYGFEVVDLGKDVNAATIINAAKKHEAKIVGLSALMTTTMVRMEDVIKLAKSEGLDDLKFFIGGAVVDQKFADQIGADAYAADAMDSVRIAQKFSQ